MRSGGLTINIRFWRHTSLNRKDFFGFEIALDDDVKMFEGLDCDIDESQLRSKLHQLITDKINQAIENSK